MRSNTAIQMGDPSKPDTLIHVNVDTAEVIRMVTMCRVRPSGKGVYAVEDDGGRVVVVSPNRLHKRLFDQAAELGDLRLHRSHSCVDKAAALESIYEEFIDAYDVPDDVEVMSSGIRDLIVGLQEQQPTFGDREAMHGLVMLHHDIVDPNVVGEKLPPWELARNIEKKVFDMLSDLDRERALSEKMFTTMRSLHHALSEDLASNYGNQGDDLQEQEQEEERGPDDEASA